MRFKTDYFGNYEKGKCKKQGNYIRIYPAFSIIFFQRF